MASTNGEENIELMNGGICHTYVAVKDVFLNKLTISN